MDTCSSQRTFSSGFSPLHSVAHHVPCASRQSPGGSGPTRQCLILVPDPPTHFFFPRAAATPNTPLTVDSHGGSCHKGTEKHAAMAHLRSSDSAHPSRAWTLPAPGRLFVCGQFIFDHLSVFLFLFFFLLRFLSSVVFILIC
jgi:hypothetical protein